MQLGIRMAKGSWHLKQLMFLADQSNLPPTTIGRDLLLAALEQTSDNPPEREKPFHLQKFDDGAKQ